MKSKNWSRRSVLVCGAISLFALRGFGQTKIPVIAVLDAADAPHWQVLANNFGWRVITVPANDAAIDARVQALAAAVQDAIKNAGIDPARIYLAGRAEAAAAVFYTISRIPDLWAGAVAVGGTPQTAIDSERIFAANFANVPVLWISSGADDEALAKSLRSEKLNVEWRAAAGMTNAAVLEWLSKRRREEFPAEIDCETNSPTFARCYWIQMTRFDANERNDVLPTSRLRPGSAAALDLGGFGYRKDESGPGILISYLPEKYSGPLKMGDRIVALDGRPIENARQYVETMAKMSEERPAVATVQRGKERIRLETRIILPRREPMVTARVQAQYVPADKDIQIISRTVKEMRVTIPPEWAQGGRLYWNGLSLEKIDKPGCFVLTIEKELLRSTPCAD